MGRPYVDPVPALKAQLAAEIVRRAETPGAIVSAMLRIVGGPRLSNLRLSRLDRFSVQGLIRTLARLGYEVEITLTTPDQVRMRESLARLERQRTRVHID